MFLRAHWEIGAIAGGAVVLRLAQYVVPPIGSLPDYWVEETFTTFLLTNIFLAAATVALYSLGRELHGMHTGIVAAMLFAVSPLIVYYGRFHLQQAAALATMVGAVLCATRWLRDAGGTAALGIVALAVVVLGSLALALDLANLHFLAAVAIVAVMRDPRIDSSPAAVGPAAQRPWPQIALLLFLVIALAVPLRTMLFSTGDFWAPPIPAPGAIAVDGVTLAILWDRVTVLLLPSGGVVLLVLGLLYVRRRFDAILLLWALAAVAVCVWTNNRHLVQGATYVSILAVLCLGAGRGAAIILAAGQPHLVRRNLATFVVAALVLSTIHGESYALARIPTWTMGFVSDREAVPLSWIDRLRAHGAWYFMSSAPSLDQIGDRTFAEQMQAMYGSKTFNRNLLFPIFRAPADTYQPPGRSRLPLMLEAEELTTHLGRVVFDANADNGYAVRSNREGFVLHGPYLVYPEGEYVIDFRIRAAVLPQKPHVGYVDVAQGRAVLAQVSVDVAALPGSDYGHVELKVELPRAAVTEFRFFGYGMHTVWLDNVRIRPAASPSAPD